MHTPYFPSAIVARGVELGGGDWQLQGLTPITVLFGKNGSGKSKLLRALRAIDPDSAHYVIPERAGELDYQPNYLQGQMDAQARMGATPGNFSGEYRRQVIIRIQAYFAARGDHRGETLPTDPEELERFIQPLLPDFSFSLKGTRAPPFILERISTGQPVTGINDLSSGETQILALAIDILTIVGIWDIQKNPKRLLLVDEPDAHLHPDLQVRFADFLVTLAERFDLQIIVATHSTTLLAALGQFAKNTASVLYVDPIKTTFKAEPFTDILRELSACLGGHALMGPLFGSPLLLVEGDDDYRIWSQVPRHHKVNFSVIPCGGDELKKYQRSLEKVFAALKEPTATPAGYALIDADKGKPNVDGGTPQAHVRYIQLSCHESENLYLADEVLALMGTTWNAAATKIVNEAEKYGQKAAALKQAGSWDRDTFDVKDLIGQVAQIVDPKKVHWTLRVAKVLGEGRPVGHIKAMLSEEVVTALWGAAPAQ